MNRPKLILVLLLVLLAVSMVVAWFRMPEQKRVDQLTFPQGSTGGISKSGAGDGLRLDLTEQKPVAVVVRKNIFKPLGDERARVSTATGQRLQTAPLPPPPPPAPQEIARKQLAAFTVIGSYIRKNVTIVFLARGEEVLAVRVGDALIPGYRVVAIQDDQLRLRSDEGNQELMLQ